MLGGVEGGTVRALRGEGNMSGGFYFCSCTPVPGYGSRIPVPAPEPSALLHPSVQVKMTDTGGQSWLAEAAGNYTTNMKCTWYVLCRVPVPWPNCTYTWFYTRSVHLPEEVVWQEI